MLLLAAWFVFLKITGSIECIKPRSVNVALETVIAFEDNNSANVKFIDDVQNFLTKVKKVVNRKTPQRRTIKNENDVKFIDFITQLINILKSYQNDDLEDIFAVLDDEVRKYHYKGCKFYELVADQYLRRSVARKLDMVKEKPAKVIRKHLDATLEQINNAKYDAKQSNLLDYIESLYTTKDRQEFSNILKKIRSYKHKSKRAEMDLIKMVRDGIRFVIFDHYSGLNINTRRDIKAKIEAFFSDDSEKKAIHRQSTLEYNKIIKRERNIKNKAQDKEFIDVLIRDVTPFNRYKNRQSDTMKHKKNKKDFAKEKVMKNPLNYYDDDESDTTNDVEEMSNNSSNSNEQPGIQSNQYKSSSTETDSKNHQKQLRIQSSGSQSFEKRKKETDISKNGEEDVEEDEDLSESNSVIITLYPETITTKLMKKDKFKSITKRPIHTMWQSDEVNIKVTKIPIKNKHSDKNKNKKLEQKTDIIREDKKRDKKKKDLVLRIDKNREHSNSREGHGIRFILTGQKSTTIDPNVFRVKSKKYIANDIEDEMYKNTTKRHKTKQKSSGDEISTETKTNKREKHISKKHKDKISNVNKVKRFKSKQVRKDKEHSVENNLSHDSKQHKISQTSGQESESTEQSKGKKAAQRKKTKLKTLKSQEETSFDEESSTYEEQYTPIQKHLTTEDYNNIENDRYPVKHRFGIVKPNKNKANTKVEDFKESASQSYQKSEIREESTEESSNSNEKQLSDDMTSNNDINSDRPFMRASPEENKNISTFKISQKDLIVELKEKEIKPHKNRRTNQVLNVTKSFSNQLNVSEKTEKNNIASVKPENNTQVIETEHSNVHDAKINNTNTNFNDSLSLNISTIENGEKNTKNASIKRDSENFDFIAKKDANYTEEKNVTIDLVSTKSDNKTITKPTRIEELRIDIDKFLNKINDTSVNHSITPKNETVNDKKITKNEKQIKEIAEETREFSKNDVIENLIDKNDTVVIQIDTNLLQ